LIPRAEDRIALAIAHGGLDGHTHSDWLVDCAAILQAESVDWHRLGEIIVARHIEVPAAITFAYFKQQLGFEVPPEFLREHINRATSHLLKLCSGLVQIRPKERSGPFGQILRGLAKKHRMISGKQQMPAKAKDRELAVRRVGVVVAADSELFVKNFRLISAPESSGKGNLDVDIVLDVQPTTSRRRIEMEIVSGETHLCRVRFRKWNMHDGPLRLHVTGTIEKPPAGSDLELVSRPSKQLRRFATEAERQRYDSLPFRVVSCKVA